MIKDLTVFVIDGGNNPNLSHCLNALKDQTVTFKQELIKDYSPMSKAFQEMLNRCNTKYYIQVDSDFILNVNSVEIMYNKIIATKSAMECFLLFDSHLSRNIFGVKIYDYEVFKKFPYNLSVRSCEMDQLNRIEKAGCKWNFVPEVMGVHSPLWSESLIFDRYYDLMKKYIKFHYKWMETVPKYLLNKYLKELTPNNLYALLGALGAFITPDENKEKNYLMENQYYTKLKEVLK